MTETQARRDLKAYRLAQRMSVETLWADMRVVLGRTALSIPTLRRFERGDKHTPHEHTLADIADYLKKAKRGKAA